MKKYDSHKKGMMCVRCVGIDIIYYVRLFQESSLANRVMG